MIGWLIKLIVSAQLRIDEIYVLGHASRQYSRGVLSQLISNWHHRRSRTPSSQIPMFQRAVMSNREVTSAAVGGRPNTRLLRITVHCSIASYQSASNCIPLQFNMSSPRRMELLWEKWRPRNCTYIFIIYDEYLLNICYSRLLQAL